jgi:hypothetical protein
MIIMTHRRLLEAHVRCASPERFTGVDGLQLSGDGRSGERITIAAVRCGPERLGLVH